MKVSNNINATNTIFAKSVAFGNAKPAANLKSSLGTVDGTRLDTFKMAGVDISKTDKMFSHSDSFKSKNNELLRNLDALSKEDKQAAALGAYYQMQQNLKYAAESHQEKIDVFKDLKNKKDYYNFLLENEGNMGELDGKYLFSQNKAGDTVSINDVRAALNAVQKDIDSLMEPRKYGSEGANKFFENFGAKAFTAFATAFETVTGISDPALEADSDDTLMDQMEGITEQTFIQRHGDAIKKINERSDKLESIIDKYTKDNSYAKELFDNPQKAEQSKPQIYVYFEDEIERLTQINKELLL